MKTKRHLIQIGLLAAILLVPAVVQAQFTFTINNDAITITKYTGSGGAVIIPNATNGYPVTAIGTNAFVNCTTLTSVTIPDSVISIGDYAFCGCTSLTGVIIPNGITNIGQYVFAGTSLTNVTIPNNVTNIGDWAFYQCEYLASITIGTNVTSIGNWAFCNCYSLTDVKFPDSVKNIGNTAFVECNSLTNVTIGNGVTTISDFAFQSCLSLTNVTIPSSVTNIGYQVFDGSEKLISVTVNSNNPAYSSLAGVLFNKNQTMLIVHPVGKVGHSYTIPSSVNTIADVAFHGCLSLTNITIPSSVSLIGADAFYVCDNVLTYYFQGNAPSATDDLYIAADATIYYYSGTSGWSSTFNGIKTVMLNQPNPAGSMQVTITPTGAIAAGAQWSVDGGVPQPSGATVLSLSVGSHTLGFNTVYGWTTPSNQIISVSANTTATASGTYVLQAYLIYTTNNGAITITGDSIPSGAIVIPGAINGLPVTSIGENAFSECYSLTNFTLGPNITSIGDYAFFATGLTSITIPNSVTNIGDYAFLDCGSLHQAYFQGNAPTVDGQPGRADITVFYGDSGTAYYLPSTTGWGATFGGWSTAEWYQPKPTILGNGYGLGLHSNSFGFTISWATNLSIIVQATTNLVSPVWTSLATNPLVGGTNYFSDPKWTNYPRRFYRITTP